MIGARSTLPSGLRRWLPSSCPPRARARAVRRSAIGVDARRDRTCRVERFAEIRDRGGGGPDRAGGEVVGLVGMRAQRRGVACAPRQVAGGDIGPQCPHPGAHRFEFGTGARPVYTSQASAATQRSPSTPSPRGCRRRRRLRRLRRRTRTRPGCGDRSRRAPLGAVERVVAAQHSGARGRPDRLVSHRAPHSNRGGPDGPPRSVLERGSGVRRACWCADGRPATSAHRRPAAPGRRRRYRPPRRRSGQVAATAARRRQDLDRRAFRSRHELPPVELIV